MKILKKHRIKIMLGSLFLILFLILYCFIQKIGVGKVGDCVIRRDELQFYIDKNRAFVVSYFHNKYQADTGNCNFFTKSYNGEVPKQMLLDICFKEIVKDKCLQMEGVKYGFIDSCDYNDFKEELQQVNKERNEKLKKGGIVYGPENYEEREYYSYVLSTLEDSLKETLVQQKWHFTKKAQKEIYDTLQDNYLKKGYSMCVVNLFLANMDRNISESQSKTILKEAFGYLLEGKTKEYNKKQIKCKSGVYVDYELMELTPEKIHREDTIIKNVYMEAIKLPSRTMGTIKKEENGISVICLLNKKNLGKKSLEETKDLVYNKWVNQKFASYMSKKERELKIQKSPFIEWKVSC